ncbi:hypothetical protein C2S52_001384 [Perilla frutescens var. hirtella]|nr:hypothetical protein C2S51_007117 [Perilla frutescens var. frutescens]KAH6800920.1 hypothetical protein C2S52_001384 [Perilla frutescens var. hirtella]
MVKIMLTGFLATIMIALVLLDSLPVISALSVKDRERLESSWSCGGKSRKMYGGCWKRLMNFEGPARSVRLREAIGPPPSPQHSQPPPTN